MSRTRMLIRTGALFALCLLSSAQLPLAASDEQSLWAALKTPGHFAIMRHALAPGTGDPSHFRLEDCSTQRNLSDGGRRQAERTGAAFRSHGIASARILSSRWCRCLETGRLLGLGTVEPVDALNSFFQQMAEGPSQIARLRKEIADMDLSRPVVMVTHQVVITGLTDVFPASGEIVVMRRAAGGELVSVGRIAAREAQ